MSKKVEELAKSEKDCVETKLELIQTKTNFKPEINKIISETANKFSEVSLQQEYNRGKEINDSLNVSLIILGLLLAAVAAFLSAPGINETKAIILKICACVVGFNLLVIMVSFIYRKKHYLPSGIKTAEELLDRYMDDCNFEEFKKDKESLKDSTFVLSSHDHFSETIHENNIKKVYLVISAFLTILSIIVFIIALFFNTKGEN